MIGVPGQRTQPDDAGAGSGAPGRPAASGTAEAADRAEPPGTVAAPGTAAAAGGTAALLPVLAELEDVLRSRRHSRPEGSYSVHLLTDSEFARRKLMEEAFELCLELGRPQVDPDATSAEAADLLYHLLAALTGADVPLAAVLDELRRRRGPRP